MAQKYTADEIAAALASTEGWSAGVDCIRRTLIFPDHVAAMGFVVRAGMAAEVMNHHPDLRIVYNRVEVVLNSHDAGGVTERDIRLAQKLNALL